MSKVQVGKIYRHYKGNFYKVVGIAKHSETCSEMVVYQSIVSDELWVRPIEMWDEVIPEKNVLRFTLVED